MDKKEWEIVEWIRKKVEEANGYESKNSKLADGTPVHINIIKGTGLYAIEIYKYVKKFLKKS